MGHGERSIMFRRWTLLLLLSVAHAQPSAEPPSGLKVVVTPQPAPTVVLTPEADAQRQEASLNKADQLRREGNQLYSQGRYREAIAQFEASLKLKADIELFYSIGVSYQQIEVWNSCIYWMDQYLQKASDEAKRGRAINARKNCQSRIDVDQKIIVESNPTNAKVYLDDKRAGVVGMTPYERDISPGPHKIWVEMDGYELFYQNFIVSKKEPFKIKVQLSELKQYGFLYVDCNIKGAHIFVEGKNVGITPMTEPIKYHEGKFQVTLTKDGYSSSERIVEVSSGRIKSVDAVLIPLFTPSGWRSVVGWTFLVSSVILGTAGAIASVKLANEEYNDTDEFKKYADYEKMSYWIGGGVAALSLSLIIWDAAREEIPENDINLNYKKPIKLPQRSAGRFQLNPLGFSLSF